MEKKRVLLERMTQYIEEHGLTDDNPIDDFPELKEYWTKNTLSQIEVVQPGCVHGIREISCEGFLGGLIQTASGNCNGMGRPFTKRSGFFW